jgi:hypothetical protein
MSLTVEKENVHSPTDEDAFEHAGENCLLAMLEGDYPIPMLCGEGDILRTLSYVRKFSRLRNCTLVDLYDTTDSLLRLIDDHCQALEVKSAADMAKTSLYSFGHIRNSFTDIFSWSIPCRKSLDALLSFIDGDKVLEIGAGRGLWSALFRSSGLEVECTSRSIHHDSSADPMDLSISPMGTWTTVELLDSEEAIAKYSDIKCLFVFWDSGALSELELFKGNKLIIIGEYDGCTGYIEDGDHGFTEVDIISIRRWHGIHDSIRVYTRK